MNCRAAFFALLLAGCAPPVQANTVISEQPPQPAAAETAPSAVPVVVDFYDELTREAQTKQGIPLLQYIGAKMDEDIKRVHPVSTWLRENSFKQEDTSKINSLYFMSYSDIVFLLANTVYNTPATQKEYKSMAQMAMVNFLAYEAMALADAARCKDKSATAGIGVGTLQDRIDSDDMNAMYAVFTRDEFGLFESSALDIEERHASRPPNAEICAMGAENNKEFITDAEWQVQRKDVHKFLRDLWQDRYQRKTKPQ